MKNTNKLLLCTVIVSAMGFTNAGDFVSLSSGSELVVGESSVDAGPHTSGLAGIGVNSLFGSQTIDLIGFSNFSGDVVERGETIYEYYNPMNDTENHGGMGNFSFTKVGDSDVWFGEWSKNNLAENMKHREVFYVGDHEGTTLPGSGLSTYSAYAIQNHDKRTVLKGEMIADFNVNTLTGFLTSNQDRNNFMLKAKIDPTTASFEGNAYSGVGGGEGWGKGHFFGRGATSLAGIARFDSEGNDLAFGGTKNEP